ncbi:MAG: hypothetical protein RL479_2142, partial [Verrucomicrobiota bacterium]
PATALADRDEALLQIQARLLALNPDSAD